MTRAALLVELEELKRTKRAGVRVIKRANIFPDEQIVFETKVEETKSRKIEVADYKVIKPRG